MQFSARMTRKSSVQPAPPTQASCARGCDGPTPRTGHSLADIRIQAPAPEGDAPERERPVQLKASHAPPGGADLSAVGAARASSPLPRGLRVDMERAFGHDFSRVRVGEGDEASALGALAFTRGATCAAMREGG